MSDSLQYEPVGGFRPPAPAHVLAVVLGSTFPLCAWGALVVDAIMVSFAVGHWPTNSNPDPKDVLQPAAPSRSLIMLAGPLLFGVLGYTIARFINQRVAERARRPFSVAIGASLYAAGFAAILLDPHGIVLWWMD
jgi:hypothetical protein